MEALSTITNWLTFLTALALPQMLGLLVNYRMKGFPKLAHIIGFVITLVLSFKLLLVAFTPPPPPPGEYVCGLVSLTVIMSTLFFTAVAAVVSIIAQYCFYRKYRKLNSHQDERLGS